MAKINKVSRTISYHRVRIFVEDPNCLFSIKPKMDYFKVFKSTNPNVAIREAANYCNKYMKEYPGVTFKYSTKEVEPYNYYENSFVKEE
jgi:hypothetical protein